MNSTRWHGNGIAGEQAESPNLTPDTWIHDSLTTDVKKQMKQKNFFLVEKYMKRSNDRVDPIKTIGHNS